MIDRIHVTLEPEAIAFRALGKDTEEYLPCVSIDVTHNGKVFRYQERLPNDDFTSRFEHYMHYITQNILNVLKEKDE